MGKGERLKRYLASRTSGYDGMEIPSPTTPGTSQRADQVQAPLPPPPPPRSGLAEETQPLAGEAILGDSEQWAEVWDSYKGFTVPVAPTLLAFQNWPGFGACPSTQWPYLMFLGFQMGQQIAQSRNAPAQAMNIGVSPFPWGSSGLGGKRINFEGRVCRPF